MKALQIEEAVQMLNSTNVVYSRAGGGAGSILLVKTDNNSSIWIWCYWEIMHSGKIIATADDDTTAVVGKVVVAAQQLEGKFIKQIELQSPYYDLHVYLEDEYELIINCESQPEDVEYPLNNWELAIENLNINYCVTCNFTVEQERYK